MLKKILLKKRNEVVEGLETQMGRKLVQGNGAEDRFGHGQRRPVGSQDMDQGIDYSLLEMKYEQYKDIADAFRKLQNNTYGLCEECGEEIDIKRLAGEPSCPVLHRLQDEKRRNGKDPEGRDEV